MNYEVFELLEVGSAGATILDKPCYAFDEVMEPLGPPAETIDE